MRKNNYFLNNMSPSTNIFTIRNILHHRNGITNQKLLEKQLQRGHKQQELQHITLNNLGQAVRDSDAGKGKSRDGGTPSEGCGYNQVKLSVLL